MADERDEVLAGISHTTDRVVGRQPIIGINDQVVGFELLRQPMGDDECPCPDGEDTVTVSALLGEASLDVDLLFGDALVYCAPGSSLLTGDEPIVSPARRTVLEVPAVVCRDSHALDRCRLLEQAGYEIAVDQFAWHDGVEELLGIADVVKIELGTNPRADVQALAERCLAYGVTLLADRCLHEDDLDWAVEHGFSLFAGPAVQHPVEVSGATLAPSALAQVQLAAELLDDDLDFGRIEEILSHEPALVVQVLHLASLGAGGGLRREVHSVHEALVLMGTRRLRQWAALTVLGRQVADPRTDALTIALVRARMCELLAERGGIERGFAFTAGLLSTLDLLLGVPIEEVETRIDVDPELAEAAFRRDGRVGKLVRLVTEYQDSVTSGQRIRSELGNVELVAAMAFAWAMSHVSAMERAPQPV